MTLSESQVRQFTTEGWLFLPDLFSAEEVALLRGEAEAIFRAPGDLARDVRRSTHRLRGAHV